MVPPTPQSPPTRRLTRSRYARHRGVHPSTVARAIAAGRIAVDTTGLIDPDEADAAWQANTAPSGRPPAPVSTLDARSPLRAAVARAEATVRGVLGQHGVQVVGTLSLTDARRAHELLRAEQRA